MKKKRYFTIFLLIGFLSCTNNASIAMGSGVVVTVNKRKVTLSEFKQRLSNFAVENGLKLNQLSKDVVLSNLDNLINTILLLNEAQREGITVTTQEVNEEYNQLKQGYTDEQFNKIFIEKLIDKNLWLKELEEHLIIKKLLASHFSDISVSQREIADYYNSHKKDYFVPEMIRAYQMELPSETVAQQALNALEKGESFTKVAQLYSISPDASNGGDMGYLSARDLPEELSGILFSMPTGKVSNIVKTQFGYQIFFVSEKIPAHQESLSEAKDSIANLILIDKKREALTEWLKVLRQQANVQINYVLLKRAGLI
jgi:peptidyl-prolyl cis-trans isomerase C